MRSTAARGRRTSNDDVELAIVHQDGRPPEVVSRLLHNSSALDLTSSLLFPLPSRADLLSCIHDGRLDCPPQLARGCHSPANHQLPGQGRRQPRRNMVETRQHKQTRTGDSDRSRPRWFANVAFAAIRAGVCIERIPRNHIRLSLLGIVIRKAA